MASCVFTLFDTDPCDSKPILLWWRSIKPTISNRLATKPETAWDPPMMHHIL